jgi:hypothetical protein
MVGVEDVYYWCDSCVNNVVDDFGGCLACIRLTLHQHGVKVPTPVDYEPRAVD